MSQHFMVCSTKISSAPFVLKISYAKILCEIKHCTVLLGVTSRFTGLICKEKLRNNIDNLSPYVQSRTECHSKFKTV